MANPVVQYMLKTVYITNIHWDGASSHATETVQGVFGAIQFVLYGQTKSGLPNADLTGRLEPGDQPTGHVDPGPRDDPRHP